MVFGLGGNGAYRSWLLEVSSERKKGQGIRRKGRTATAGQNTPPAEPDTLFTKEGQGKGQEQGQKKGPGTLDPL
jgi:hypothetical protein